MTSLNPRHVPSTLERVIPLAEKWGVSDDVERTGRVDGAATEELRELVEQVDIIDTVALYGWLSGPEAYSPSPSDEYVAFTALTMAADYARAVLSTERE